jgi:hypothetical protein
LIKKKLVFNIGDVVIDDLNKEVGVLLRRYNLFDDLELDESIEYGITMVWEIYWTGPKLWPYDERVQVYTEEGLELMLDSGILVHYKNT